MEGNQDKLNHMLELQKLLEVRFFGSGDELSIESKVHWTKEICIAIMREMTELLDGLPKSKHWKETYEPLNLDNVLEEIVDMTHFLLALAVIWGFDAESLYQGYVDKNRENIRRYDSGY